MQFGSWHKLELYCGCGQAESLGGLLMEKGSLGVEYQTESSTDKLVAYFDESLSIELREEINVLLADFDVTQPQMRWSVYEDIGWSKRWREFFKPLEIGNRLVICPSWEEYKPNAAQRVLKLDPGMAFGTGQHPTTRGTLLLLDKHLTTGDRILDVGCGSGILAIASLLLGAKQAIGIDNDPDAVIIAQENAIQNGLSEQAEFKVGVASELHEQFDLVMANIQAEILQQTAADLLTCVKNTGILIMSGILNNKVKDLVKTYIDLGAILCDTYCEEEWFSIAMIKISEQT
jgi:ribosomal protein L11 methyltransferase